jgi:2-dehydropantoate 2-reductase
MRYVIYGAGAVGGAIGAGLFEKGQEVVLIARGSHLEAIQRDGLRLERPEGKTVLPIPAIGSPLEAGIGDGDIVVLAMKSQHTTSALDALAEVAPSEVPVICAQNGVENERLALRRFNRVYGACVIMQVTHLEPGVVQNHGTPLWGIVDLGRFPAGSDEIANAVAADLNASGFRSEADPAIMRKKYRKLVRNLTNAIDALSVRSAGTRDLYRQARDEAYAVFEAAGIDVASEEEDRARREGVFSAEPSTERSRPRNSSWQSLARHTGSVEVDYLNGEIVLLGRLHGVATPVNQMLQKVCGRLARERVKPGSVTPEDLLAFGSSVQAEQVPGTG